ncbi:TetR/AcrR family transcriptional regulator [Deinococcus sp. Arct2-2]|uniref:TetR/AcrR family transcriptional regulator n=1 Tax=Deinococcus sp. Arct2-2 TaxID=2568653 RepID=UPI0010A55F14|nr:TetR family transcriptional regulator [Deinococcus sp. Arct2-2]THF67884.1 TetR/AcrR family transcriptional regulator [Deinococcus sp. Arct2-2]
MSPANTVPRSRNAAATRAAILQAAQGQFARSGYEGVGLREIAAEVGVNAALVVRYFGSKEQLFTEAIAGRFALGPLLEVPRMELGERLAHYVLHKEDQAGALDPLLMLLRSAAHPQAGALLRLSLEEHFVHPLASWLGGPDAMLRAELIAATLSGLTLSRFVLRLTALSSPEVDPVVDLVAPTLQAYVDGPVQQRRAGKSV